MTTATVNISEFQAGLNRYLATTSRTLEEATNSRLSFVLKRVYELLYPADATSKRQRIKNYLDAFVNLGILRGVKGRRVTKRSMPLRIYKIVQARQKKAGLGGLYGDDMRKAVGRQRRRAVGSVGYLAAPVARAWLALGRRARGAEPGTPKEKPQGRTWSYVIPAKAGFSPKAVADMAGSIANDQAGEVDRRYARAFQRAFDLELEQMNARLAAKMKKDAKAAGMKVV